MKLKISKEEYDKLPDLLKAEYTEKNGAYHQNVPDTDEAIEALRLAKENEKKEHKATKDALENLKNELAEIRNEGNRKKGDVEALETSWKGKLAARETELTNQINALRNHVIKSMRDATSGELASAISTVPSVMKRILTDRMTIDFEGETPSLRILGIDGKPSALTIEDLKKEILANPEYAPIIIGSKASGGASKPANAGGANERKTYADKDGKPVDLASMTPGQLVATLGLKKEE